jgi:alpha-L-fucosidase
MPAYLKGREDLWAKDPRAANTEWFREARLGLFLHYGVSALGDQHVWEMYGTTYDEQGRRAQGKPIPVAEYEKRAERFTAEKFDADFITDLALEAGCRYVNLTTRHHDGFCLWDSASEPFNTMNTPAKRDLVQELSDACSRKGLGFLPYWSLARDWRHPHAPPECRPPYQKHYGKPDPHYAPAAEQDIEKYNEFVRQQVKELFTRYQLAGIWFDGVGVGIARKDDLRLQQLYDFIHELEPTALISYKQGVLGTEDLIACEGIVHGGTAGFDQLEKRNAPREICSNVGKGWGWNKAFAAQTLTLDQAWKQLRHAAAQNANWLANTGPRPDGSINPPHADLFRRLGEKIRKDGLPAREGPQFEADRADVARILAKRQKNGGKGLMETP